jgi:hypothetical protein
MQNNTLVYLEFAKDQIFYVNGFKKDVITPYLNVESDGRGLYALWGEFDLIFNKTTKIPKTEKFYYPIVFSRWEITKIFNEISISPTIIKKVKAGQCKILILNPFEGWTWTWWDEIGNILKNKFDISSNDIIFVSGNYYPNQKYKTIAFNTWERQIFANYRDRDHYERTVSRIKDIRPNKFICLNRRPSIHRYAVVTQLYDVKDQGILTCASNAGYSDWYSNWVQDNFIERYPELEDKFKNEIKSNLPLKYNDGVNPEIDNPASNETVYQSEKYYNSYLYVVTETFFEGEYQGESTLFLSEKIFKPVVFFQPFVAFARPGTLNLLKKLGYKTFENYIDESYDSIEDDKERMYKALESVKAFISLPQDKLAELMMDMLPIFEHNYKTLKENYDVEIFKNLKTDLYNCLHGEH